MRMRLFTLLVISLAALFTASCGPDEEVVEPLSWPFLETTEPLTINGAEFDAYVASTEVHRIRAVNGVGISDNQAIAYLYPEQDEPVKLRFTSNPDPIELVFIGADGKVIETHDVPAFSQARFPQVFAVDGARVVLQLRKGSIDRLKLSASAEVTTDPDLVERSADAEPRSVRLYFVRPERDEEKPEDSPFVRLKLLKEAEDVAQLVKDRDSLKEGEGVLVPIGGERHKFWLKEASGTYCACYVESAGRFGGSLIQTRFENISAAGGRDIHEPVYYSTGDATFLAIWKGADYFEDNDVRARSPVTLTGVDVRSHDEFDYDDIEIEFGESVLHASLARGEESIRDALLGGLTLEDDEAVVLSWDDPEFVEIDAPAGVNLWFVGVEDGKYSIQQRVKTEGGKVDVEAGSRFVIVVPEGFEAEGELKFPYLLRDLKPAYPPVVFYNARQADVVEDRWPTEDDNYKALARVELAVTDAEQRRGLMYRESLREDYGMIFVYEEEQSELSYWMKNCRMNLSIAFVTENGVITRIHNVMQAPEPGTPDRVLERYESGGPAKYAIEMRENWFKDKGIERGDRIFIPPALKEIGKEEEPQRGGMQPQFR